jgi:hypothetical protein
MESIGIDYTLNAIRYPLSEDTLRPMAAAVSRRYKGKDDASWRG